MNTNRFDKRRHSDRFHRRSARPGEIAGSRELTPEEICQICLDPALRIRDHSSVADLAQLLMVTPQDEELLTVFSQTVRQLQGEALVSNDAFRPNYPSPKDLADTDDIVPLAQMPDGRLIGPHKDRTFCNTAFIGRTGTGKSSLAKLYAMELVERDYCVVMFDFKKNHRHLATLPLLQERTTVLDISDLKLASGQPPPDVSEKSWGLTQCDLVAGSYQRMFAHRQMQKAFESLRLSGNIPRGSYISLGMLIHAVDKYKPGRGYVEARYRESMLTTLESIDNTFGRVFHYVRSNFLEKLFSAPGLIIIEVRDLLPGSHYVYIVSYLVSWLNSARLTGGLPLWPPVAFFLDDVTAAADAQLDREAPGGTSPLSKLSFMCRSQKIAIVFMVHAASSISQKILANTENICLLSLSGEDPRRLQHLLGLTPEQIEQIRLFRPGELAALFPSVWPLSVYGRFPLVTPPGTLSDEACRDLSEKFLAGVSAVESVSIPPILDTDATRESSTSASSEPTASPEELAFLTTLANNPVVPVTKLYATCGLTRSQGRRMVAKLEGKAFVRPHKFSGRRGGASVLLEILPHGWLVLSKLGLRPPEPVCGGGSEHTIGVLAIGQFGKRHGMAVRYEVDLPGARIDVELRRDDGFRILHNVGISSPERELENALRIVRLPAVVGNQFVLVGRATFTRKVKLLMKQKGVERETAEKVELKTIAHYL